MDNLKNSIEKIVSDFSSQFKNNTQVQAGLLIKENAALRHKKKYLLYEENNEKEKQNYEQKSERLIEVTNHIPYVEGVIKKAEEEQNFKIVKQYSSTLIDETLEKSNLEKWMQNNNAPLNLDERMKYELDIAAYEYNVEVGKRLAEWFATGAAGPGTVEFMGKEYTA